MKKVMVALSGGVDSTVSAYLLKKRGYYIEGVYMKLFDDPIYHEKNLQNIEIITEYLGIDYHILDIRDEFKKEVYTPFVETYKKGETPNPCVICNRKIKLGKMLEFAKENGFDYLATGHYAKIENGHIVAPKDRFKDQSYFLSNVKKEVLSSVMFPLGDMLKDEVKEIASKIEVLESIAKQKESSEICFVPTNYLDILKNHYDVKREGEVIDRDGNVIGYHFGYMNYTIGQRKGFRLKRAHKPHYVLEILPKTNQIVVGQKDELLKGEFFVKDLNLFDDKGNNFECEVKIRYRSPKVKCKVFKLEGGRAKVLFETPQAGITPSQIAAFYEDNKVIGSAVIVNSD